MYVIRYDAMYFPWVLQAHEVLSREEGRSGRNFKLIVRRVQWPRAVILCCGRVL